LTGTEVNDATKAYLEKEKVMCTIYQYLDDVLSVKTTSDSDGKAVDVIKQNLIPLHFIWQDGHFLSVDQVVKLWNYKLLPYLCELSSANKRYEKLFSVLGVREGPSAQKLAEILKKIRDDHDPGSPVSESIMHFIENVVKELESRLITGCESNEEIFLPDENRVMRPASQLAAQKVDCTGWLGESEAYKAHFESGSGHFVYDSIPPRRAKALGARPILDAILKAHKQCYIQLYTNGIDILCICTCMHTEYYDTKLSAHSSCPYRGVVSWLCAVSFADGHNRPITVDSELSYTGVCHGKSVFQDAL